MYASRFALCGNALARRFCSHLQRNPIGRNMQGATVVFRESIPPVSDQYSASWQANRAKHPPIVAMPGWMVALRRGLAMRCPSCGEASAFAGYLAVQPICPQCAAPLGRVPCDDAPPYITLLIALHVIVVAMVLADYDGGMSWITSMIIFVPLTIVLLLGMLRPVKGATLAIMLKINMLRPVPVPVPVAVPTPSILRG
jgi:uncharacterized protein (DUF983 family)